MSLDIEWSKLDQELAVHVQHFLNRHFKSIAKPAFIGDIEVTAFEWGTESPRIEITNITDPFPEFYEEEHDDNNADDVDNTGNTGSSDNNLNDSSHLSTARSTISNPTTTTTSTAATTAANNSRFPNPHDNELNSTITGSNSSRRPTSMPPSSPPILPSGLMSPSSEPFARFAAATQHRFNLGHSFHRSPFVAPQHPFHHTSSYYHSPPQYFPSPRSPPETSWHTNTTTGTATEDWIDDDEILPAMAVAAASVNSGQSNKPPSASQQQQGNASTTGATTSQGNPQHPRLSTEMDFQTSMLISYKGDMSMTLMTELRMNYPSMMFMSLPIQLRIRSIEFESTAIVAYIKSMDRVCVSMLEPEQSEEHVLRGREVSLESLLREVQIESIVGDSQKQVLKNVGKVERFIVDQLRKMLDDELVFPSYQCIQLD